MMVSGPAPFLCRLLQKEIKKMSDRYGYDVPVSNRGVAVRSAINAQIPNAHPCNCDHECSYGKDRAFCFPCMKNIMDEFRAKKKEQKA